MSPQELQFWETIAVLILLGRLLYAVWHFGLLLGRRLYPMQVQLEEINVTLKLIR